METNEDETVQMEERAVPWRRWSAGPSIADIVSCQADGASDLREVEVIY